MNSPLWTPSEQRITQSAMDRFRRGINAQYGLDLADFAALHQWSVTERASFWQAVAATFDVRFHTPPTSIVEEGPAMPGGRWFAGATLNFAEHLLRRRDEHPALVAVAEDGGREVISYAQLAAHVAGLQRAMKDAGISSGDRVAAFMPNTWQTVAGMLAASSLGAIWSSCSPDFGTQGVIDRFGQIEPVLLIASYPPCAAG